MHQASLRYPPSPVYQRLFPARPRSHLPPRPPALRPRPSPRGGLPSAATQTKAPLNVPSAALPPDTTATTYATCQAYCLSKGFTTRDWSTEVNIAVEARSIVLERLQPTRVVIKRVPGMRRRCAWDVDDVDIRVYSWIERVGLGDGTFMLAFDYFDSYGVAFNWHGHRFVKYRNGNILRLDDEATQIALAQAQGIDPFALNFGSPSWEFDRMPDGYNAAAAAGFKMFLSFDMTSVTCASTGDITTITITILCWANHATQLKDSNGAVYVGPFAGEYCTFGSTGWLQAVKSGPKSSGVTTKFIPSFFSDPSQNFQFTSFMDLDGTVPCNNAWPMDNYDETWTSDTTRRNRLSGTQVYMAGVSPWFFTGAHFVINSIMERIRTTRTGCIVQTIGFMTSGGEDIIAHRSSVDLVEIITWNDYDESHYIGPIGKDQPISNAWVDGFDRTDDRGSTYHHSGQDYMWARPHGKSDTYSDYIGRPNNADWTNDYLWIVLLSTGPGTLQVQQGTTTGSSTVTAGINKLQLASGETNSGVNGVTAVLTRNSAQVFPYFAPITFTHSPTT
ncbi:hypothetical protein FRC04_006611 [Tulasnella sp. 424]|nr:hypothetical protein FRC04_006611 [Tulasnella sp. 424]